MKFVHIAKTALGFLTGFGIRDFIKKHKKLTAVVILLVVLNEVRGLLVVGAVVKAMW